jgi:FAD/FMN-containing dehydrogenase
VCIITCFHAGDPERGRRLLAPLRETGRPLLDLVEVRPYLQLQSLVDATLPHGWQYHWKSANLAALGGDLLDTLVDQSEQASSPRSLIVAYQLGGAIEDVATDATAYAHRGAAHNLNISAVWLPSEPVAEREIAWARRSYGAVAPHQTGADVNFLDRDDQQRVLAAYGSRTYQRLLDLKSCYDPDNVFHTKLGVAPARREPSRLRSPGR